jgi:PKD repeat protein
MKIRYFLPLWAACILLAVPVFSQNQFPVRFSWGTEYFPENFAPGIHTAGAAEETLNGYYVRYIQCRQIPTAADRAALESAGLKFLSYVPFGTYLVAIPQNLDLQLLERLDVRSVMPVAPTWKLSRSLREPPYGAWAVHGDQIDVHLQVYPHLTIREGADLCRKFGLTVLQEGRYNGFIKVRFSQESLDAAANMPFVRYLELMPEPGKPEDTYGRSLHRSNLLDSDSPQGLKFNGEGVTVLVRDDGTVGPHIDFQGRLTNVTSNDGATSTHGDGVAGIIAGAGNLDPDYKGMAAGAEVYAIDYTSEFQDTTLPLHLEKNITITNSSYSNGCNDGYTLASQTVDQQIFDHPTLMHVFSAGNAGTSDCDYGAGADWGNITGGHKMGKNAIATANLNSLSILEESSSRGPAHDGRLKPDIAAHGAGQYSTDPNNEYQEFGGTSAAAPGIAGCLAQLTHAYKTWYNGDAPESGLLKAILLNTANDLGNPGPDFLFGWGHVNAYRALRVLEESRWLEGQVEQGESTTHTVQVPPGTRLAKVMAYWVDPAAATEVARALVNDLDITTTAPDGTVGKPWKLDPTPDPLILSQPAGRGRDSLNNMEQVALENPAPGSYTVTVHGTEVPFGPQSYVLIWEFISDEIKITYPAGGEGFVPGESERIHWDAYGNSGNFTLRYSTDNGLTFNGLTNVTGEKRFFDWNVPNTVSGQVRLMLIRGAYRDTTDHALSIAPTPSNVVLSKVCPDSMTFTWNAINDTLQYDVYVLGDRYMDVAGTSATNTLTLPHTLTGDPIWYSARASYPDGLTGRRALAQMYAGGLLNCPQPIDLELAGLVSPAGNAIIQCGPAEQPIQIQLHNAGLNPISGALLHYQIDNEPAVTEPVPDIAPGSSLAFQFQTGYLPTANGEVTLRVWSTLAGDLVFFNDTIVRTFPVITSAATSYFIETFPAPDFPPTGWTVENPDESITWAPAPFPVTGANGAPSDAVYINYYNYSDRGQEDYFYMVPVDLTNLPEASLVFDVAYAEYNSSYVDGLRVEVFPGCDLGATPVVVYHKTGPDLSTTTPQTGVFAPNDPADWRTELVDLSAFAGGTAIIRFVAENDYGNNLYIDNAGVANITPNPPAEPQISLSATVICPQDTIQFSTQPQDSTVSLTWSFGLGAQPATASGAGPHDVKYLTGGNKNVRVIAANSFGADTTTLLVPVLNFPLVNFTTAPAGLTVTFNNTSLNTDSYLWDFGDGFTSTEISPVHTYAAPGTYTVILAGTNACKTNLKTVSFSLTVGTHDLSDRLGVSVQPNPTEGDFRVELDSRAAVDVRLSLYDAQGRLIRTDEATLPQGRSSRPFTGLDLPKGLYQLQVQTADGLKTFKVAVQ